MFVTASLIDPSGQPVVSNEELEMISSNFNDTETQPPEGTSTPVNPPVLNPAEDLTSPLPQ
jgi:hypothetical protein